MTFSILQKAKILPSMNYRKTCFTNLEWQVHILLDKWFENLQKNPKEKT